MAILTILGWVGDAFAPTLLDKAPLLLLVCNPRLRNLVLVSPMVDFVPFVRRRGGATRDQRSALLLVRPPLRRRAIRWMERRFGAGAAPVLWAEKTVPQSRVAGRRADPEQHHLSARGRDRHGVGRLRDRQRHRHARARPRRALIGSAFSEPILAFNAWIGDNRLVLTVITIGITFLLVARSARHGRDPIETPAELADELDGMYKDEMVARRTCSAPTSNPAASSHSPGSTATVAVTTGGDDPGVHVVCARMTAEFLAFSQAQGNDLSTPMPEPGFPGLLPGDRWCLCASRWQEALEAGVAPPVYLEATHIQALEWCSLDGLRRHALDEPGRASS